MLVVFFFFEMDICPFSPEKSLTIGRIECIAWATSKFPFMVEQTEYFMWITPTLDPLHHCT